MSREETLNAAEHVLKSAGFKISKRCSSTPSCFCMVARKTDDLTFIKVPSDLGKVSLKDALQMQAISSLFQPRRCLSAILLGRGHLRTTQSTQDTTFTL